MDPTIDSPKLPDMVMCGDHPSFTKNELKEPAEDKEAPLALPRPNPSNKSFREKPEPQPQRVRASTHVLRAQSGALVQAALGSFRWPPYLVGVWVCVLVLTHALHCVVGCLERALPRLKAFCQYLRSTAERSWHLDAASARALPATLAARVLPATLAARVLPATLAALAAACYAVYFALYVVYSIALWSIEPLAEDVKVDSTTKVTDYTDVSDDSMK